MPSASTAEARISGLALPTDIIFDSLNRCFWRWTASEMKWASSIPTTFQETPVLVGINPTSLDYNFQTSTAVTVNSSKPYDVGGGVRLSSASERRAGKLSGGAGESGPGLGGSQSLASVPIDPQAIAVDPRLNLAVLVDPGNNRILLVPLLH